MKKLTLILFAAMAFMTSKAQTTELAGEWQLTCSPFEGGAAYIPFTATLADDGKSLACHADAFLTRNSHAYPMDWKIAVEQQDEQVRLGWILDAGQPASTEEFQETASQYIIGGADPDGSHRYIYLLSENIETQKLEGMTLWSDWQSADATTFTLPKMQQIYAAVSPNIPYNGAVGYIDIWASGRIEKKGDPAGISEIVSQLPSDGVYYDLQGRRLSGKPQRGIYIRDGKKFIIK